MGKHSHTVAPVVDQAGTSDESGLHPGAHAMEIRDVRSDADLDHVRSLLRAYVAFLAASTAPGELDLDGRLAYIADLPGANVPPHGALMLALIDGEPAGCVAFGPVTIPSGETVAELRRMWVSPAFRGHALGRSLVLEALARARAAGYCAIYLNCLQAVMPAAMKIYRALGFEPTEAYKQDHPVPDNAFLRLDLCRRDAPRPDR